MIKLKTQFKLIQVKRIIKMKVFRFPRKIY